MKSRKTRQPGDRQAATGAHSRQPFKPAADKTYIAFNKPFQVLSQFTREPASNKSTLGDFDFPQAVYGVGRLDYDSEGLLLLSDDGRLNKLLLDPQAGHERTYLAQVETVPSEAQLDRLRNGLVIEGRTTLPASARLLPDEPELWERHPPIRFRQNIPTAWVELKLHEGKNRQVRKMTAAVGCPTLRLVRTAVGKLTLADLALAPGQWRSLTASELLSLFR